MSASTLEQRHAPKQASKDDGNKLRFKENEWREIAKLCVLMGLPANDALTQAEQYRQARITGKFDADDYLLENNIRTQPLPYHKQTSADIQSILKTGEPIFESIHDLLPQELRAMAEKEGQ